MQTPTDGTSRRRSFFANILMAGGLTAGYGTFVAFAGRFLYPSAPASTAWRFVAHVDELAKGDSRTFVTPAGAKIVIARQGDGSTAGDFIALSSVCPHLGCQVHWEAVNDRFFCPCHNGAFDAEGRATEGPPAAAGQELARFPLEVRDQLLFIEVPLDAVTQGGQA